MSVSVSLKTNSCILNHLKICHCLVSLTRKTEKWQWSNHERIKEWLSSSKSGWLIKDLTFQKFFSWKKHDCATLFMCFYIYCVRVHIYVSEITIQIPPRFLGVSLISDDIDLRWFWTKFRRTNRTICGMFLFSRGELGFIQSFISDRQDESVTISFITSF